MYHTAEMLEAMARVAPELLAWTTVCSVDNPGPDTAAAIAGWLRRFDGVQVAARVDVRDVSAGPIAAACRPIGGGDARRRRRRSRGWSPRSCCPTACWCRTSTSRRSASSLPIAGGNRSTSRRRCGACSRSTSPRCASCRTSAATAATFGRDLMEAGFDPRDVMDKSELGIVHSCRRSCADLDARLPLELVTSGASRADAGGGARRRAARDRRAAGSRRLGRERPGRAGRPPAGRAGDVPRRTRTKGLTWQQLIGERIADGPGVPVLDVGQRLAEAGAERAELSNLAARHVHAPSQPSRPTPPRSSPSTTRIGSIGRSRSGGSGGARRRTSGSLRFRGRA